MLETDTTKTLADILRQNTEAEVDPRNSLHFKEQTSGPRKLVYTEAFKNIVRGSSGVIAKTRQLMQKAVETYSPIDMSLKHPDIKLRWNKRHSYWELVEANGAVVNPPKNLSRSSYNVSTKGGIILQPGRWLYDRETQLSVQLHGISNREYLGMTDNGRACVKRLDKTNYFKVKRGDHTFFVKDSTAIGIPGFSEFVYTRRAMDILQGIPNLRFITPLLGYQDSHRSFYIAEWDNFNFEGYLFPWQLESVGFNEYGIECGGEMFFKSHSGDWTQEERDESERQLKILNKTFTLIRKKFREAGLHNFDLEDNLFFHPTTEEFIIIDISIAGTTPLGYTYEQPATQEQVDSHNSAVSKIYQLTL